MVVSYEIDVSKHARYFQMVLNGIPSKSQDMQRSLIAFFCLCGLDVLGELKRVDKIRNEIVAWLKLTQNTSENRCFRGSTTFKHQSNQFDTPHLTMTAMSMLSLVILGENIQDIDVDLTPITEHLHCFQTESGCFQPSLLPDDELDVRFCYSAMVLYGLMKLIESKLGKEPAKVQIDIDKMVKYLDQCTTYETAFTVKPDLESHAGAVYCSLASLKLAGKLDDVVNGKRKDALIKWLLRRQNIDGGFNGRPNKPSDSCYFFWVGASLAMLDAIHFVDPKSVLGFCQEVEDKVIGGFSKLPGSTADPLHSFLTLAGLSLFGTFQDRLGEISPEFCFPKRSLNNLLI